jgi:hypothetical protein
MRCISDDILAFGQTEEVFEYNLRTVFIRLYEYDLKFKAAKRAFDFDLL